MKQKQACIELEEAKPRLQVDKVAATALAATIGYMVRMCHVCMLNHAKKMVTNQIKF